MEVKSCPIRAIFGPLTPERVTWRWNRFTEYLEGTDALEYLRLLNAYLPKEAWGKIMDLPWQIEDPSPPRGLDRKGAEGP